MSHKPKHQPGHSAQYEQGYADGFADGHADGYDDGFYEAWVRSLHTCLGVGPNLHGFGCQEGILKEVLPTVLQRGLINIPDKGSYHG